MTTLRALFLAVLGACASTPTGASCPTANPPTYDSFGREFFATYCTDCHSATSQNRHGAPAGVDFDTEADIQRHAGDIDLESAAGPKATNTSMPDLAGSVVKTEPSQADRETLGQFLACEQR